MPAAETASVAQAPQFGNGFSHFAVLDFSVPLPPPGKDGRRPGSSAGRRRLPAAAGRPGHSRKSQGNRPVFYKRRPSFPCRPDMRGDLVFQRIQVISQLGKRYRSPPLIVKTKREPFLFRPLTNRKGRRRASRFGGAGRGNPRKTCSSPCLRTVEPIAASGLKGRGSVHQKHLPHLLVKGLQKLLAEPRAALPHGKFRYPLLRRSRTEPVSPATASISANATAS